MRRKSLSDEHSESISIAKKCIIESTKTSSSLQVDPKKPLARQNSTKLIRQIVKDSTNENSPNSIRKAVEKQATEAAAPKKSAVKDNSTAKPKIRSRKVSKGNLLMLKRTLEVDEEDAVSPSLLSLSFLLRPSLYFHIRALSQKLRYL